MRSLNTSQRCNLQPSLSSLDLIHNSFPAAAAILLWSAHEVVCCFSQPPLTDFWNPARNFTAGTLLVLPTWFGLCQCQSATISLSKSVFPGKRALKLSGSDLWPPLWLVTFLWGQKAKCWSKTSPKITSVSTYFTNTILPIGLSDCFTFSATLHLSKLSQFLSMVKRPIVCLQHISLSTLEMLFLAKALCPVSSFVWALAFSYSLLFLNVSLWSKANLHGSTGKAKKGHADVITESFF